MTRQIKLLLAPATRDNTPVNAMALIKLFIAIELIVPLLAMALVVTMFMRRITKRKFVILLAIAFFVFAYSSISLISHMSDNCRGEIHENHKLLSIRGLFCV